ncbi:Dihydrolipoamide acetyltransferase, partial [Salmonella enterica subsp. enterica serovar Give str. S5-487]
MAIEIKVPDIGTDEVEITEILVKVGDKVEAEQSLIRQQHLLREAAPAAAPAAAAAKDVHVPDIGSDEVEVTEVMVKVGDTVEAEQSLITVEGDKASMEVPSPQAGVVKEIKVSVGDKTETGALIMIFDSADGAADAAPAKAEEKKEAAPLWSSKWRVKR